MKWLKKTNEEKYEDALHILKSIAFIIVGLFIGNLFAKFLKTFNYM